MQRIADIIDTLNLHTGRTVAWLTLGMVAVMFVSVVQRYLFDANAIWQTELVMYMHAIVFMSAAGYALLRDAHVRIDVFYCDFNEKKKAWVNILGTILFLFPVCIALVYFSWDFVISSWEIKEHSSEYGGLPGIFLLKTFIWIFSALLFLQGVSLIVKGITIIRY